MQESEGITSPDLARRRRRRKRIWCGCSSPSPLCRRAPRRPGPLMTLRLTAVVAHNAEPDAYSASAMGSACCGRQVPGAPAWPQLSRAWRHRSVVSALPPPVATSWTRSISDPPGFSEEVSVWGRARFGVTFAPLWLYPVPIGLVGTRGA